MNLFLNPVFTFTLYLVSNTLSLAASFLPSESKSVSITTPFTPRETHDFET